MNRYKELPLETYPRRDHFRYFCSLPYPYLGVTVPIDVTDVVRLCKEKGYAFYLTMMHLAALAADSVPEFRQRIIDGKIIEYVSCPTSHTELKEDGTYAYCTLHHDFDTLEAYLETAERARSNVRTQGTITEDEDVDGMYFISTLPWLHYTTLLQPVGGAQHSNPRLSWGKYETDASGRLLMPFSVLTHHGLVDGIHLAQFFDALEKEINRLINGSM